MKYIKNKSLLFIVLFAVFLYMSSRCTVVHADDATIRGSGYIGRAPDEETPPVDEKENLNYKKFNADELVVSKISTGDETISDTYEFVFISSGVIVIIGAICMLLKKDNAVL